MRKIVAHVIWLSAALMLSGCESLSWLGNSDREPVKLDEELLEQVSFYRPYEIYTTDAGVTDLGAVQGIDCSTDDHPADERNALLALKADAFNLGGNAVVLAHCQELELSQCHSAVQCDGTGYSIEPSQLERKSLRSESPLDSPEIWF